jgi:hypothetical protein
LISRSLSRVRAPARRRPGLGARSHPQALRDLIVDRDRPLCFDRNSDAEADIIHDAARILFAPYLQVQKAVVDEWDGLFAVKALVKYRPALHRIICRLIVLAFDTKRLYRLEWGRFEADTTITLMARFYW